MSRLLKLYVETKRPIEIIYMDKNGILSQRKILVINMTEKSITAYCHLRKTKRTFIINNILSFKPINKYSKEEII